MALLIVLTTIDNKKKANKLAKKIVKGKLAACVHVSSSITSHYIWGKRQQESKEYLMMIKTIEENYDALKIFLNNNHPYQVPEIISFQIHDCNHSYLNWVIEQTKLKLVNSSSPLDY